MRRKLIGAGRVAVMRALQDAYWMAKEQNKEKYTPKKYRKDSEVTE